MNRNRCPPKTLIRKNGYRFELVEVLTVSDLVVLGLGEEGGSEASDDALGVAIFNGESCHFHG